MEPTKECPVDVGRGVRAALFILGSRKSRVRVLPPFPTPLLNSQQPLFPPKQFHPCRRTPIIRKRLRGHLGCLPGAFLGNLSERLIIWKGWEPRPSKQKVNWDQSPKTPFFIPGSDLRLRLLTSRDQELPESLPWPDLTSPAANPELQEPVWGIPILASPRRA